jgi:hypothetical protein
MKKNQNAVALGREGGMNSGGQRPARAVRVQTSHVARVAQ